MKQRILLIYLILLIGISGFSGVSIPLSARPVFVNPLSPARSEQLSDSLIIVFYSDRDGNQEVYRMKTDGSELQNLTDHPAKDNCPAISPDGLRIAFLTTRDGNQEIYLMNHDGTNPQRLTATPENEEHPSWSYDGSHLYFIKDMGASTEVWKMAINGSNPVQITSNPWRDERPMPSPDGTAILFMSNRDGRYEIYTMDPEGNNQTRITNTTGNEIFPVWSPDGTRIAYSDNHLSGGSPQADIHVMNADGTGDEVLTSSPGRDENPCWMITGNRILFQSERDGNFEIYSMNPDGSDQQRITVHSGWDGWPTGSSCQTNTAWPEKKRSTVISGFYPNPFSTDATLEIHLDQPGIVQADLFNLTGKLLHTIFRQQLPAGIHKIPFTGENLGAGIYIVYLSIIDQKDLEIVLLKEVISVEKTINYINQ